LKRAVSFGIHVNCLVVPVNLHPRSLQDPGEVSTDWLREGNLKNWYAFQMTCRPGFLNPHGKKGKQRSLTPTFLKQKVLFPSLFLNLQNGILNNALQSSTMRAWSQSVQACRLLRLQFINSSSSEINQSPLFPSLRLKLSVKVVKEKGGAPHFSFHFQLSAEYKRISKPKRSPFLPVLKI